jgi:hypothetical protein
MTTRFWNVVLTFNSAIWFIALIFMSYSFGMLFVNLDWKQFLLSILIFASVSLTEIVLAGLAFE